MLRYRVYFSLLVNVPLCFSSSKRKCLRCLSKERYDLPKERIVPSVISGVRTLRKFRYPRLLFSYESFRFKIILKRLLNAENYFCTQEMADVKVPEWVALAELPNKRRETINGYWVLGTLHEYGADSSAVHWTENDIPDHHDQ